MGTEANITINGLILAERESMIVRIAVMALADIVDHQLKFKEDGVAITRQYQSDIATVPAILEERRYRPKVN